MEKITIDDFSKVDIRIGTVIEADVPDWSHWVMRLKVDLGAELGIKKIFSGIMKFYKVEELVGHQFPFVVNLEPKNIGPADENGTKEQSEGMMIMAVPGNGEDEETKPILFNIGEKVPNGTKIR